MKSELKVHWKMSNSNRNHGKEGREEEEKIIYVDVDKEDGGNIKISKNFGSSRPAPSKLVENGGGAANSINKSSANLFASDTTNLTNIKRFGDEKQASSSNSNLAAGSKKISSSSSSSHSDAYKHRQFCKSLKTLNQNVFDWIDKHLKTNPYLDLTPVFNDYVTHYKSLQQKFNVADDEKSKAGNAREMSRDNDESGKNVGQQPPALNNSHVTSSSSTTNRNDSSVSSQKNFNFGFQSNATTTTTAAAAAAAIGPNSGQSENGAEISSNPLAAKFAPIFGAKNSPTISFGFGGIQSASSSPACSKKSKQIESLVQRDDEEDSEKEKADNSTNPFKKFCFVNQSSSTTSKPSMDTTDESQQQKPSIFAAFLAPNQNQGSTNGDEKEGDNDGEVYEPPKPESVQIEEKDAFYSIKCKLFYNLDGKFVDKGLGTLHLKKMDNGKTQLLIRNDTALGNVLLNILLSEAMPCTRTGKNNVTIVCVPNPPLMTSSKKSDQSDTSSSPTTVAMLIRVKTSEDADELCEKISKAKASV